MQTRSNFSRLVIGISAYKSDESVLQLLEQVYARRGGEAAAVIVVDSESEGSLGEEIGRRGWPVKYDNSPVNLGSAGNLARRLELAAGEDADWCFALNHDGTFDRSVVEALVRTGETVERVGAAYPRRVLTERAGTVLLPHISIFEMPRFGPSEQGMERVEEVAWDSSNGALYALAPIRERLKPWADLWMGWEDLAYGWQLSAHGWKQLYCPEAVFFDDYEYEPVSLLGRRMFITRKPPWYGYYQLRNLFIILRRTRAGLRGWLFLLLRLIREFTLALFVRNQKKERLRMLAMGLIDGLRGMTGRGRGR